MKVDGSSVLHAEPARVWDVITDPDVLAGVIPGCQGLTPLAENHFGLTVSMGVAAIKGSYAGEVRLDDLDEPWSLTMRAAGSGAPGTLDTTVRVRLTDLGDGTTRLDYDADAVVGGMVGGVGQRVLTSVARKTAGLFFAAIDDVLTGKQPIARPVAAGGSPRLGAAAGSPAPGPDAVGPWERPLGAMLGPSAAAHRGTSAAMLLIAVAGGAVSMAIGVLIGARIAGRPR